MANVAVFVMWLVSLTSLPPYGDLTRIGHLAEEDFGWTKPAPTVDPAYLIHSLHSYFLRPGDTRVPIVYDVERIRDGRSFATRRVSARQHGRPIFYLTANFQREEEGLAHQDVMPEVPGPEEGVRMVDLMRASGNAEADALAKEWASLDARFVGSSRNGLPDDPSRPARSWNRIRVRATARG